MPSKISAWVFAATFLVTACVTINVYFPAAAAEKAADRIIDDVWQQPAGKATTPPPTSSLAVRVLVATADFVMPRAEAQQQPNIDVSSPEVQRIKDSMQARFDRLKPFLDSGAAGLTGDGLIALREANAVPLAQRNAAKSLIAEENADRIALYSEIATANGQPQWAGQIQSVFAQRWVAKAQSGWWYQDSSGWKKK